MAITDDPSAIVAERPVSAPAAWGGRRRQRAISLAIALAIEALIVALLFTLGAQIAGEEDGEEVVTEFTAIEFAAPPEPEPESQPEEAADAATPQEPQPVPDQPLPQPQPLRPSPLVSNPTPAPPPPPPALPQPKSEPSSPPKIGVRVKPNRSYGPADTGDPRSAGDSEQVGTAPNGEPLYAARWYREPTRQELSGYLSTATAPAAALIACRTVPDYYVEDCVLLSESPQGSQIGRAVMAAAWQFRVRPARVGGREKFGSWVRIRIDYGLESRPRR